MITSNALQATLKDHQQRLAATGIRQLFTEDPERFANFSAQSDGLLLDFSKHFIDSTSLASLVQLCDQAELNTKIADMFNGEPINNTEKRKVLHTALRAKPDQIDPELVDCIASTKAKMFEFADRFGRGEITGHTGKPIDKVVNIGVGGSDLGPFMAVEALSAFHQTSAKFEFVSNIDPVHISRCLQQADPETTLFIVCSKTFTTLETLANANAARAWFIDQTGNEQAIAQHFYAVSTNLEAAAEFGIPAHNIYPMWDWVGGRYSMWSAIGLVIALAVGSQGFEAFLAGGQSMDQHFRSAPPAENLPVIMALLGIWYGNFFDTQTQAVICYDQNLERFPDYLQQLDMESNGKSATKNGDPVDYKTGSIVWGGVGTNTQHSFHQLIHQGQQLIPVDFVVGVNSTHPWASQQQDLFSNCLAQSQAMLEGRSVEELLAEMAAKGIASEEAEFLAKHRYIAGNKPSSTLVYEKLTPFVLGQLVALYEHKVFAQSVIWDINAFDQWGVELGKQMSKTITKAMADPELSAKMDSSTQGLIRHFLSTKADT